MNDDSQVHTTLTHTGLLVQHIGPQITQPQHCGSANWRLAVVHVIHKERRKHCLCDTQHKFIKVNQSSWYWRWAASTSDPSVVLWNFENIPCLCVCTCIRVYGCDLKW